MSPVVRQANIRSAFSRLANTSQDKQTSDKQQLYKQAHSACSLVSTPV